MAFDFIAHRLVIQCSDGATETIPLEPRTVADFYRVVMDTLRRMGISVRIWTMPVEIPDPIRFEADDIHRTYEAGADLARWNRADLERG